MSRYIEILAIQRPFPFASDENNRVMFSVNFSALAEGPVTAWEEEIVKLIVSAGLATALGVDIFAGPSAVIPVGDGPFIQINDSGGITPDQTHNGSRYERLSAQIVVRALSYTIARTKALAIWRALDGVRDTTVTA